MNALRIKDAGNVIILSGYYNGQERARFADCARCGVTHKLVKAGRIWSQPEHDCDGNLIDAMRFEQRREEHRP